MPDRRSRKDRLADPDRWYRMVAMSNGEEVIDCEANQALVKGRINDIVVVAIPSDALGSAGDIAMAMTEALRSSGIARDVIVVPNEVTLLKLRPMPLAASKKFDKQKRAKEHRQELARKKAH